MPPYTLREGLPTAQKASAKTYKRLQPIAPGYSGVSRPRRALLVRRSGKTHLYPLTSTSPPESPHLPGALGTSTMRVLAAPSWGVGLERRAHPDKSLQPLFLATRAGVGYLYY